MRNQTSNQTKFLELKPQYEAEYKRTNGKDSPEITYSKGFVRFGDSIFSIYRIAQFEKMLKTLKQRPIL